MSAPAFVRPGGDLAVTVGLRNTGRRAGREVVQVYASRPDTAIVRPLRWLAGFAVVDAEPGQAAVAEVTVRARAFEHLDAGAGWTVEPGTFGLEIGRSVADLPIGAEVTVAASS